MSVNELFQGTLSIAGWSAFSLTIAVAVFLNLLGLFGSWLIVGAVIIAYVVTGFSYFSIVGIVLLLGLAILGEIGETAAAGYGASRFGGSRGSIVAAIVGCIAGAILGTPIFPLIGTVIGACAGAFVGALLYEYIVMEQKFQGAARTGVGAALGKVGGILAKFGVALVMVVVIAFDLFVFRGP